MKVAFSPYELIARADGRRRAGALLRVTYVDCVQGYADLHPWPELGDDPLDRQLRDLSEGCLGPLTKRSLHFARVDGEARAKGRSLFDGLAVPPSHASLPFGFTPNDLARAAAQGYDRVKLKGWDFAAESIALFRASGLKFRFDFNARLDYEAVERLLDGWGDLDWIDWLEDPCPYDPADWQTLRSRVRVARDFEEGDKAFDVRVVKPARDNLEIVPLDRRNDGEGEPWEGPPRKATQPRSHLPLASPPRWRGLSLAFTSYLDHPVGQLGAAWTAARAVADGLPVETGGLVTHEVYEPTVFSRQLGVQNARLVPPGGPGIGFAGELETLEWRTLRG